MDLPLDYQVVEVTDALISQAIVLAQRYKLRGYYAVQLAAANEVHHLRMAESLSPLIFISADNELNSAALAEGLAGDNPNAH